MRRRLPSGKKTRAGEQLARLEDAVPYQVATYVEAFPQIENLMVIQKGAAPELRSIPGCVKVGRDWLMIPAVNLIDAWPELFLTEGERAFIDALADTCLAREA